MFQAPEDINDKKQIKRNIINWLTKRNLDTSIDIYIFCEKRTTPYTLVWEKLDIKPAINNIPNPYYYHGSPSDLFKFELISKTIIWKKLPILPCHEGKTPQKAYDALRSYYLKTENKQPSILEDLWYIGGMLLVIALIYYGFYQKAKKQAHTQPIKNTTAPTHTQHPEPSAL